MKKSEENRSDKKTNGQLTSDQIEQELRASDAKKWKGGDVYKTIVHKTDGSFQSFAPEGFTTHPTPILLGKNTNMAVIKALFAEWKIEVDLTNYQLKTCLFKML